MPADPHRSPALEEVSRALIARLIAQGLSKRTVADRLGRSKAQVDKAVRELGGVEEIRRKKS